MSEELQRALQQLNRLMPDRSFLLEQAENCRHLAIAVADQGLTAELQGLATAFEEAAR